ncbi:MepB family protein [Jeotgalicoccus sp. S0W5]|uniref:MepB family protein n=1 Tax=Jeotgalicoccus sp. S0W5 TaxID=2527874 RepID=UPI001414FD99|nr:MepB family protein [Jeotgalicoccus sp. S0W5]
MFESVLFTKKIIETVGLPEINTIETEPFNTEYESCNFYIGEQKYRNRMAKKTENKKGYFVVFWTKDKNNKNRPYTWEETPEKLIVTVLDQDKKGQFIFPREVLLEKQIISKDNIKGKMAMRVYPSWEDELNKTAMRTQNWQNDYFIDFNSYVNEEKINILY